MKRLGLVVALLAGACGDDGDAIGADAAVDSAPSDVPDTCPYPLEVHAQLVDIDSTVEQPMPIAGAHVGLTLDGNSEVVTDSNGEFVLSVPACQNLLEIDAPGDYLDGQLFLEYPELYGHEIRMITATRAASLYDELGLTFDANRGQMIALDTGDRIGFTVSPSHDAIWTADEMTSGPLQWMGGVNGRYSIVPNILTGAPGDGVATLTETATLDGPVDHTVVALPGRISLVVYSTVID
jgi:hypothetical protein